MTFTQIEFASPEYDEAIGLRYEILRKPLGLTYTVEQLAEEWDDFHLVAYDADYQMIGYLNFRILDENTLKMRQVAIAENVQNHGVGTALVHFSENFAKGKGYEKIILHARETAIDFYLKNKYRIFGEPFKEVGIAHRKMEKFIG
jgi:N-acetylglutamate synthase-like GNAT family acetyltransferase